MDVSIQDQLCKSLRAVGLPKKLTHRVTNQIVNWYDSSGPEWTNSRLKDLKMWYETTLTGKPLPPPWFKKTKKGTPQGVFGEIFRIKDPAKVFATLSANTLFVSEDLSPSQKKKFLHGLDGNGKVGITLDTTDVPVYASWKNKEDLTETEAKTVRFSSQQALYKEPAYRIVKHWNNVYQWSRDKRLRTFPELRMPDPSDVTATTVPLGRNVVRVSSTEDREYAYLKSWDTVPYCSLEYLDSEDRLEWWPEQDAFREGYDWRNYFPVKPFKPDHTVTGRIGFIQEGGLKCRTIGNPNRISQALMEPLALYWELLLKYLPSDCTFDQEEGVRWVQEKLQKGLELSGSDLTSATDLLDLNGCLDLVSKCIPSMDGHNKERYDNAVRHFTSLSRGEWVTPKSTHLGKVGWKQGQPLGATPSFRLLALTNNLCGRIAACQSGLDPDDSFRVIGDDIIMDSRMAGSYEALITSLGGEINHTKTITSSLVAEFAGRIILPHRVCRKTYNLAAPSDDSFMSYLSDLGPQAVGLLRPRQRDAWDKFKYVPGVAFDGPWSPHSLGEPLVDRVAWVYNDTSIMEDHLEPDQPTKSFEQSLLYMTRRAQSEDIPRERAERMLPLEMPSSIHDDRFNTSPKPSGDPRRVNGKSTLQHLEDLASRPDFREYKDRTVRSRPSDPGANHQTDELDDITPDPRSEVLTPEQGGDGGIAPPVRRRRFYDDVVEEEKQSEAELEY